MADAFPTRKVKRVSETGNAMDDGSGSEIDFAAELDKRMSTHFEDQKKHIADSNSALLATVSSMVDKRVTKVERATISNTERIVSVEAKQAKMETEMSELKDVTTKLTDQLKLAHKIVNEMSKKEAPLRVRVRVRRR